MKKTPLRLIAALMLGLGTISTASASSLFSNFYFFGDSLSDMGNNTTLDGGAPITNPGGATWASYFASQFGNNTAAIASNNGGNNYAFAGAQTVIGLNTGTTNTGTFGQVLHYLEDHTVDPHALYSIWAGANDIEDGLLAGLTPAQIIAQGTSNTGAMVQALHNAGAKYIMVFDLPNLADTPLVEEMANILGPQVLAAMTALSSAYNQVLNSTLNNAGFDVIQLDIFSLLNDVVADPAHFGLSNVTSECSQTGGNCAATFLFWDDQHPTTAGHTMIADYAFSVVTGPTRAAILAEAPFSIMDAQNTNIENELYNMRTGVTHLGVGQFTIFGSGNYAPSSQNSQGTAGPGYDSSETVVTQGIVRRFTDHLAAGFALGRSFGHVDFGQDTGGFDMAANMASLFGNYQYNKFYTDLMATFGVVDYSRVTRKIVIGPSQNEASGNTEGTQIGGNLVAGYNIINRDNFQTGPLLNADYQHIRVNAYAETGSIDGIAEQFDDQSNDSLSTGAGWQLAYTFDVNNLPVMPFAQVTYNHQWLDKDRDVGAGLVSLPGSHFTIPVSAPNGNYGLASAGLSFGVSRYVNFSLGYQTTFLYSGTHSQNYNASIQVSL